MTPVAVSDLLEVRAAVRAARRGLQVGDTGFYMTAAEHREHAELQLRWAEESLAALLDGAS